MKNKKLIITGLVIFLLLILVLAPIVVTKANLPPLRIMKNNDDIIEEEASEINFTQNVYTDTTPLSSEELKAYSENIIAEIEQAEKETVEAEDMELIKQQKNLITIMDKYYKDEFWQIKYDIDMDYKLNPERDGSVYPNSPDERLFNLFIDALENENLTSEESKAIKNFLADTPPIKNNDVLQQKILDAIK